MEKQKVRVLSADVYDTLELSALAFGGIGAGRMFDREDSAPYCLYGHAAFVDDSCEAEEALEAAEIQVITTAQGLASGEVGNDNAVRAINRRQGVENDNARVAFSALMKELNVVRGS